MLTTNDIRLALETASDAQANARRVSLASIPRGRVIPFVGEELVDVPYRVWRAVATVHALRREHRLALLRAAVRGRMTPLRVAQIKREHAQRVWFATGRLRAVTFLRGVFNW